MKLIILFIIFLSNFCSAQNTYDIFSYTVPKGYKQEDQRSFRQFTKVDNIKKSYCILSLYKSQEGTNNLMQDFNKEWDALVAKPFKITATPDTEQATSINGYEIMGGIGAFKFDGKDVIAIQYVYSGFEKASTVLVIMSSMDYMADVETFIRDVKPIAPPSSITPTAENKPNSNAVTTTPQQNNGILGEWYLSDGNAKITLLFGANGRYDKGAMVDRRIVSNLYETTTIKGKGTYTLNGSTLTLTPTSGSKETYQIRFSTDKDSEGNQMKILHLKRPVEGGQLYESDYYFVPQKQDAKKPTSLAHNTTNNFMLLNGDGITGIWISYGNNTPFISGSSVSWNWRVFFTDGKSLSNLPNGGFANLKAGSYLNNTKNDPNSFNLGNYTFSNNKGTNTKAGSKFTDKLELTKPNQLKIDGTVYMKCANVTGQKLKGSFTTFADPNDPAINQTSGFRSVITFSADGKFNDEGIYQVLLKDYSQNDEYNAPGKGSYELKDYSIILKFDDGRVKQEAFTIPFSNTTNDARIILISRAQLNKMK